MASFGKLSVALFLATLVSGSPPSVAAEYQFRSENKYFDRHVTTPAALLAGFYKDSKVLLLGAANHRDMQHHLILIDLLKSVGTDPHLKYLVLEQFADNDTFYKELSFEDVLSVLKKHRFNSEHERLITLCWSREWTWVYTHIFPVVQEINKKRPADDPLIVRAVDGFSIESPFGLTSPVEVTPVDCRFNNPTGENTTDNIQNREQATAEGFYTQIWNNLAKGQKAIVLYHQAHLYRYFESCRVVRTVSGAESRISPRNWFSTLMSAHPEVGQQAKLVIFDETDATHHPQGVLRFTRRQIERRPGVPWAIDVRGMKGIDLERGQNALIFGPTSYLNEGLNHSDRYFYEILDGVIYSPRAELDHKVGNVTDYMGDICPKDGYDGASAIPFEDRKP